ncbi:PRC-barrel domain-containing protein [Bowmanella dokdonensis]|uniref:PRC-barrel domain-containing protein n=1 Tax=Bowmanella dokdonensis TaxID=751969 RepID=A0A939DLS3_9ALTE|nr:PRC-barrel domain-containing protein [Bowmanella dokdonensis]MBN7825093.1 PRC-barrel domain-containing protein [Bowmanella dokdonensis]
MKKLRSIALCALITPVVALSAGSVLAEQSAAQDKDREQQSQHKYDKKRDDQTAYETTLGRQNKDDKTYMANRGFLNEIPANGLQASHLIGATVNTSNNEEVGSVNELIIDSNGQVVALVVSVGGFLGLGEKDVAIGWDDIQTTGSADADMLQTQLTREELSSAPKFEAKSKYKINK